MHFLLSILFAAAMFAAPAHNADTVVIEDATPLIRPQYQPLARGLAISPAFIPTTGNEFTRIAAGTDYGKLLFADFRSAQSLVELEIFLFGNDPDGIKARDILFERIKDGVEVRYIHDGFGNFFDDVFDGRNAFTDFYDGLRRGGIQIRNMSPAWRVNPTWVNPQCRNHRKINIIDKKIAYTGGMNITEGSISGWGDAMLRIIGPAVQSLRSVLLLNWNDLALKKSDRDELVLNVSGPTAANTGKILQVVADGPDQPAMMWEATIIWLLDNAREYFWFETPYFMPDKPILKAIKRAVDRGIDIKIICPYETDLPALDPGYRSCIEECYKYGAHFVYRQPPFNHSKVFLCDDYILSVGSTNMDKLSLNSLYEVNVLVYDEPTALEYKAYLQEAIDKGWEVDQKFIDSWDSKERFMQGFYRVVGPFL